MNAARWQQIVDLFHEIVALPEDQRIGVLVARCGTDAELRLEVESMLAYDTTASDPIAEVIAITAETMSVEELRRKVGNYRLEGILGHGGMGTVYSAVSEDAFQRRVAIKVLKSGPQSQAQLGRFQYERKLLARLEHPSIARLFEAGVAGDGQPYLAMEYVEGSPVTRYCSEQNLTLRQQLELFQKICTAVQYAHRNLIIHRDIKPNNILVTSDGHVKLLDFGIGKLLEEEVRGAADTTVRMFTPDYASPEQVRGKAVTTATDIYSLGVLLYEMLSNARPVNAQGLSPLEMERVICEVDPLVPSAIAGPARASLLRGDLDTIVMMALRKEPERRYSSVEQFSNDIAEYLKGMPVRARPGTLGYRMSKLVKRQALAFTAIAAILVALVGSIALGVYQTNRANRRFGQVQKLAHTFLFDFHDKIQTLPGSGEARAHIAVTALKYLNSLEADKTADPALEHDIADAYERIGDVQGSPFGPNLGRTSEALQSYAKAIQIKQRLASDSAEPGIQRSLAQGLIKLGEVQMQSGNRLAAVESLQAGLKTAQTAGTGTPEDLRLRGYGFSRLAVARSIGGEMHEAAEAYRNAVASLKTLVSKQPSPDNINLLTTTYTRLAYAQISDGDLEQAHASLQLVIQSNEKSVADSPLQTSYQQTLFQAHIAAGDLLGSPAHINMGNLPAAATHYERALKIAEQMVSLDPKSAQAKANLATATSRFSVTYIDKDPARAIADYERALAWNNDVTQSDPANAELQRDRGFLWVGYGNLLRKAGKTDPAVQALKRGLAIQEKLISTDATRSQFRQDIVPTQLALAETGGDSDARGLVQTALQSAERLLRESPGNLYRVRNASDCHELLARLLKKTQPAQAREHLMQSVKLWEQWQANHKPGPFDTMRLKQSQKALSAG